MEDNSITTGVKDHKELIARTIDALRADDQTDAELLDILVKHVVKLNPTGAAVSDAAAEIELLAKNRTEST